MDSDITLFAAPAFLLCILMELAVDRRRKTHFYRMNDAFGSLALGIMSKTSGLITFSLGTWVIHTLVSPWSLNTWDGSNPWVYVAMFVLFDFVYYWSHRFRHEINFLWAGHSIHHSSEDYNLTTALRQTSSSLFVWIFAVPAFLLGAPLETWLVCGAWNLIYQFWVHTRHINKLGPIEWVMVTPSHHRVHHAQNARYIDKNHGGVFIIWDRLFGTFAEEVDEEEIIYGVRRPLHSLNPIVANLQVWRSLASDAWHTKSLQDKLRIWFMPTGWRPEDLTISKPMAKADLSKFEKFDPKYGSAQGKHAFMLLVISGLTGTIFLLENNQLTIAWNVLAWCFLSAPLIVGAMLLQGQSIKSEGIRLLASWPAFLVLQIHLDDLSRGVLGAGLCLTSLAWLFFHFNKPQTALGEAS